MKKPVGIFLMMLLLIPFAHAAYNPASTQYVDKAIAKAVSAVTFRVKVGDLYQGTIVYYVDETGQHGYGVALQDAADAVYFPTTSSFPNFTQKPMGTGLANTTIILARNDATSTITAASESLGMRALADGSLCDTLSVTCYGGFNLPSVGDFTELLRHLAVVNQSLEAHNGTALSDTKLYWTSTEDNETIANAFAFTATQDNTVAASTSKTTSLSVRPVRAF